MKIQLLDLAIHDLVEGYEYNGSQPHHALFYQLYDLTSAEIAIVEAGKA